MLALISIALGGTVEVQTTTAAEIHLDGVEILRTYGASTSLLPDIEAGTKVFVVYRDGEGMALEVEVPETGTVHLRVGNELLESDHAVVAPELTGPPPVVLLRSADGREFLVVIDGHRLGTLSPEAPMSLDMLPTGDHSLELRSTDLLTVWLRGTLALQPGDDLLLQISEGRMVEVFGRTGAWQPGS